MYFCQKCHSFTAWSDLQSKHYREPRGECWGVPSYEDIYIDICPECGSEDIYEAKCDICGEELYDFNAKIEDGTLYCEECWEEEYGRNSED
jgi:hypothetical protein